MGRGARPWWLALAVSLLLHGALVGGLPWRLPQWETPAEPATLDVQLVSAPAPEAAPAARPAPPPPRPVAPRPRARPAVPQPEPPVEPPAEAAAPAAPASDAVAVAGPASAEHAAPAAAAPEPAAPPLNVLPPRIDLRFEVRYGLASGEQTLVWVNEGERYTLTSVATATGLTGVFYRGQFVQTSRGRITPRGLQPEEFWDQRGNRRSSARFDVSAGDLVLSPSKGPVRHFDYSGDVQDALSLFFQLALTAPPDGRQRYQVFNGKKLRTYTYEVRGEETLDTALGALRTLHLARVDDSDGRFEAWLAIDRHYLPVRVLRSDDSGSTMELRVRSIAP